MKNIFANIMAVLVCLNVSESLASAQNQKAWQWVNELGGKSRDMVNGLVCDSKNNLFIAGNFSGTFYAGNRQMTSSGSQDMYVARFDENGSIKDLIQAGGPGLDQLMCIALSNNNSVLLGGSSSGKAQFNNLKSTGDGRLLFVTSMDHKGKFQWINTIKPSGDASLFLIGSDIRNHIYAAGVFSGSLTYNDSVILSHGKKDIFLIKLDESGKIEKLVAFGGTEDDIPSALSVSDSGTVFLSGTFTKAFKAGTLEFNISREKNHAFLMALNNQLNPCWKKQYDSKEHILISALQKDHDGNVYLGGSYSINLVSDHDVLVSKGYTDGFVMKVDINGKQLWGRNVGTWYYDYVKNLICDNAGGVMVTGTAGDSLNMDGVLIPAKTDNTAFALQFNADAQVIWGAGISGNGNSFGNRAILDHKGNLYFSGSFSGTFEKDEHAFVSKGDQDVFIAKYFNCDAYEVEIKGDPFICPGSTVELSVKSNFSAITWSDSIIGTSYIIAPKPGKYWVDVYDKKGCLASDTFDLSPAIPFDFSLGNDQSLPVNETLLLKAPEGYTHLMWQDQSEGATFLACAENNMPGKYLYWLSAMDSAGCTVQDSLTVDFYVTPWVDLSNAVFNCYPNPVKDWLTWSLITEKPCQVVIEVTTDDGRYAFSKYYSNYQPGNTEQLNFSNVPPGVYYIQAKDRSGHGSKTVSVVKQF